MKFEIGDVVEVVSVTGAVDTGVVVGFKRIPHNYRSHRWYITVEFTFPSADGDFVTRENFLPKRLKKI